MSTKDKRPAWLIFWAGWALFALAVFVSSDGLAGLALFFILFGAMLWVVGLWHDDY